MNWFSGPPPPSPNEVIRNNQQSIKRSQRDLEREILALERQEKQLIQEIKKLAAKGDEASAKTLAKELVRVRSQRTKLFSMKAKLHGINAHTSVVKTNMAMTNALVGATRVMQVSNAQSNPEQFQQIMREFSMQSDKMDMIDEMLEEAFDNEEEEEETDQLMSKVFDEIGLDLAGQLKTTPKSELPVIATATASPTSVSDERLKRMMEQLQG
eukprot:TRINITY_DN3003_c0_g1_i1.p1 TRINITY_DN3003_c0_g1~~TRINITY_DN3003_c0_g1_i1.p1  ORF type:complete len:212 (-),score=69.56 TRINITY_DN3003_c0_g1_i1:128-763(-)